MQECRCQVKDLDMDITNISEIGIEDMNSTSIAVVTELFNVTRLSVVPDVIKTFLWIKFVCGEHSLHFT